LKMSCSEAVESGEAVEGDEADEGLPLDNDAVQLVETQAVPVTSNAVSATSEATTVLNINGGICVVRSCFNPVFVACPVVYPRISLLRTRRY